MLPHSRSNETACYMLRTQPTCTHLACRTPAHTHTRLHREQLARKAGRKERTPAERASSDRNWALNRTKYNTKPNSNLFHSIFFFFFILWQSRMQAYNADSKESLQTTLLRNAAERNGESRLKKRNKNGGKKKTRARWEGETSHFYTQVTQFDSAGAIFKTSSADGCPLDAASSSCLASKQASLLECRQPALTPFSQKRTCSAIRRQ